MRTDHFGSIIAYQYTVYGVDQLHDTTIEDTVYITVYPLEFDLTLFFWRRLCTKDNIRL